MRLTIEDLWEAVEPKAWEMMETFAEAAEDELFFIEARPPKEMRWFGGRGYSMDLVGRYAHLQKKVLARASIAVFIEGYEGVVKWVLKKVNPETFITERHQGTDWTPRDVRRTMHDLEESWKTWRDLYVLSRTLPIVPIGKKEWAPARQRPFKHPKRKP